MLLADDFVDRARAQGLGERCQRLLLAEKIVHCSPNTSTPFGGTKRNCAGSTFGLRAGLKKRSKVVWPQFSARSIASIPPLPSPMRLRSSPAPHSRALASRGSTPPPSPASLHSHA